MGGRSLLGWLLQGYIADAKQTPPRTLQQDYVQGHMVALGRGGVFLMSQVPLYSGTSSERINH